MSPTVAVSGPLSRTRERVRVRARELRRAAPEAEQAIWQRLRNRQLAGHKFRRQHPVGPFFVDIACLEALLIVELDGGQHFEPDALAADQRRTIAIGKLGFTVLRFDNLQALAETDAVLSAIWQGLDAHHPHPHPLPHAGEGVHSRKTP